MNQGKLILFLLFLLVVVQGRAQHFKGLVFDKPSGKPLPYVNIGIFEKGIGTVSGNDGSFELEIDESYSADTLSFSYLGYAEENIKIDEWQKMDGLLKVYMVPDQILLKQVEIKGFKKTKTLGNSFNLFKKRVHTMSFGNMQLGSEIATTLKIPYRNALLEKIYVPVFNCEEDSIVFRLKIYELGNKFPEKILNKIPIYFKIKKEDSGKDVMIDISEQQIIVQDDVIISIECLTDMGRKKVNFLARLFGGQIYRRDVSMGKWEVPPAPIRASMQIRAKVQY